MSEIQQETESKDQGTEYMPDGSILILCAFQSSGCVVENNINLQEQNAVLAMMWK